ncbi:hypothetical protein KAU11_05405, partial [Candidatus Babeliales bacterium]|nr:hypothetical protein [Candidatus Babeliales bacterium]
MENLKFWNQCNQPPSWALKKIQAGRLKGKSDISPQWRYQVLTEMFGPCGIGWKFTVDKLWTEPGSHEQVFAFAQISLFVKTEEQWSEPIPGAGGSMLVAKEKAGLYSSDEAYKMSITDALSTACKMLGIAADIYAGLFDGAKYANPHQPKSADKSPPSAKPSNLDTQTAQANRLTKLMNGDKTEKDLQKRYKDNTQLITSFPENLKKQIYACYWTRKEAIKRQEVTPPPVTPDPVRETSATQNEEEIPPPQEEDLPPVFDEEPFPGEPTAREKAIRDAKAHLDSASKDQLPEFMTSLKATLDKMPL